MFSRGTFNTISAQASKIGGAFVVWSRVDKVFQGGGYLDLTNLEAGDIIPAGTMVKFNGAGKQVDLVVAPAEYDAEATYELGDLVMYEGAIYKCKSEISTAEEWTAAHWEAVAGGVADIAEYSATSTYEVGDKVIYEDEPYVCSTKISVAEAWTAGHWTKSYAYDAIVDAISGVNGLTFEDVCIPEGCVVATCAVVYAGRIYADRAGVLPEVEKNLPMIEFVRE